MKKHRKIKIRKDWNGFNPVERVVPKKRIEDEKFDESQYRGLKITEEDLQELEDMFGND